MKDVSADRERLLRIAHAGLLAWWDGPNGLELVSITDWEPLTWEDSDLASRLCQGHDPLLTEGRKVDGVTRIGITERGEHVLAGDEMDVACSGISGWTWLVLILACLLVYGALGWGVWVAIRSWS